MVKLTMSDERSIESESRQFIWDRIGHSLEPETKKLPRDDKIYFESKIKLLIGKEIRLSNIPTHHIYMYIKRLDWIVKITRYPMLFSKDYIRSEIVALLFRLGIRISEEGLGWKFGPMGFQQQKVIQEVRGVPIEREVER